MYAGICVGGGGVLVWCMLVWFVAVCVGMCSGERALGGVLLWSVCADVVCCGVCWYVCGGVCAGVFCWCGVLRYIVMCVC